MQTIDLIQERHRGILEASCLMCGNYVTGFGCNAEGCASSDFLKNGGPEFVNLDEALAEWGDDIKNLDW